MNKLLDRLEKLLTPVGEKLQKIKAMSAIAEAMQAGMPILIIGSFCTLFLYLDIGPWQSIVQSIPGFVDVCSKISAFTSDTFGLFILILLTYMYGRRIGLKENLTCIPFAIAVMFILAPVAEDGSILKNTVGMQALISAMLVGIAVPRAVQFLINKGIVIRMPSSVPKFVEEGFKLLIPGFIVCILAGIINTAFVSTEFGSFQGFIYTVIQTPLLSIGLSFGGFALIITLASAILWPGLHANTIMGVITPLTLAASAANQAAIAAGETIPHIIDFQFMMICDPGGQAALLLPCLIGLFMSKSKQIKQVSKVGIVPAIFGIGEPILFGFPCMFNVYMFLPMVLSTFVNVCIWYFAIDFGLVGYFSGVVLPWTTPPILNAFLASTTPVAAVICQIFMLVVDGLIWLPFVRLYDKKLMEQEQEALSDGEAVMQTE
ncbi:PTS sugar transporter subunit IIC [Breznakia pachnodae]|uniref:Permease IIC component n=1 Tax=Breznakia pachnodae TaxID=265178 RepID=A0ABU0E2E6_9FIRM|nr:PTS transporter subunit EIIC [Breznakia pachnodae]MDQ0361059.1 PTS system cellobiose-specific IIC component [Breznakia pachnodae]